jgi:hypothetical protein
VFSLRVRALDIAFLLISLLTVLVLFHSAASLLHMKKRVLYISPVSVKVNNGMLERQRQNFATLESLYPQGLDILSLGASGSAMREWLSSVGSSGRVLSGPFATLARLINMAWYAGGVILCNKLGWVNFFYFPIRVSLPEQWVCRYDRIICYYAWAHRLLRLEDLGSKVTVDLGDVMANRHVRIGARRWISLSDVDEGAVLNSESQCYAISRDDATEFARLYKRELRVLPYAPVNSGSLMAIADFGRPRRVGFIGAPSSLNEEVLRLLGNPGFLRILSAANVVLVVAGGICKTAGREIISALLDGGAEVRGPIEDIRDFYRDVGVVINAVGPSTGVKIKSVEALVAGRTLITTQWGVNEELCNIFSAQIQRVDWPVDPLELGYCVVNALAVSEESDSQRARVYVSRVALAMKCAYAP